MFLYGLLLILGAGLGSIGKAGFSPEGIPFTNTKRITGRPAKIIGGICLGMAGLIVISLFGTIAYQVISLVVQESAAK